MKTCKQCLKEFTPENFNARNVKFCSVACREEKYKLTMPSRSKEARDAYNHAKWNKYAKGKFQCPFCKGWYNALLYHVRQRHDMSASDYKARFGLNRSHSIITESIKEKKREAVFENGTVENLKKGAHMRFVKGDTRPGMKYERREETLIMLRKRNFKKQS